MKTVSKKNSGKGQESAPHLWSVNEVQLTYTRPKLPQVHKVSSSQQAYDILLAAYPAERICYKEYFYVLFLNSANYVLACVRISEGGLTGTMADLREIYQLALKLNAVAVILSHNHPSGNTCPSSQDRSLTRKISDAGKILDIKVLDHLIITPEGYYSFADEGNL